MAHLYYTEHSLSASPDSVTLEGDEARHAASVARLRVGETVAVSDGVGWIAQGVARAVAPNLVTLDVSDIRETTTSAPAFTLVQALAKGDRDELAVQMCTELGATTIIPWQAERSISRWTGDKQAKGRARWATIAREASKQAMRATIPTILNSVTTGELAHLVSDRTALVLDPRAEKTLGEWAREHTAENEILIVVGPEGGVSSDELESLVASGAVGVRIGVNVLRTSTAGPSAIAALRAIFGQF
jgi:16S rRNA (uracil1498-N3)-methyltransferase